MRLFFTRIAEIALGVALLLGCTDSQRAGGNSTDMGNPELTGRLTLPDGRPAAGARVHCVPEGFLPLSEVLPPQSTTHSDSTGAYSFSSLPPGECALEAFHPATGMRLLERGLQLHFDSVLHQDGVLQESGALRLGMLYLAEGDSVVVYVPGTTLVRAVVVRAGVVLVDSLPAGMLELLVWRDALGRTGELRNPPAVVPDQVVDAGVLPFRHSLRFPLFTEALEGDTLLGFPLVLRLDSSMVEFPAFSDSLMWEVLKEDGTPLPHRVTRWDSICWYAAEIWVRLDTLLPSDERSLTVRWRDLRGAPAPEPPRGALPFAATDGYLAVWHFDEGTSRAEDITGNGWEGYPQRVTAVPGAVGMAFSYNGAGGHVSVPGSAAGSLDFSPADTFALSLWVLLDDATQNRYLWGKGDSQYSLRYAADSAAWVYRTVNSAGLVRTLQVPLDSSTQHSNWQMLTLVVQGDSLALWHNDRRAAGQIALDSGGFRYDGGTVEIGRSMAIDGSASDFFAGVLDELVLSRLPFSPAWIRVRWANQNPLAPWPLPH